MSIDLILKRHILAGKLIELPSLFTGDETARKVFVAPDVIAAVEPPFQETMNGDRMEEFRAVLDAFSEGARFSVAEDPYDKDPYAMLARVHPVEDELWCIRVMDPEDTDGIRCFGAFVQKDEFVALMWEYREVIDRDFDAAVTEAGDVWQDFFGTERPFFGDKIDEYITNYFPV